jgi:flagellar motor switch protein FliN/FliY
MSEHDPAIAPAAPEVGTELVMPALQAQPGGDGPSALDLGPVLDVPVELTVEIGRTTMTIRETLEMGPGSIVALDRMTGEPVDLLVNGQTIARGEVVAIDEEFGLRITQVVSPKRRLDAAA